MLILRKIAKKIKNMYTLNNNFTEHPLVDNLMIK